MKRKIFILVTFLFFVGDLFSQGKAAKKYLKLGIEKDSVHDYSGAIRAYSEAIKLFPSNPIAYKKRGHSRMQVKDLRGAISDYSIRGDF